MDRLPPQLKWAPFVAALGKLGYRLHRKLPGSARTFVSDIREPAEVSFHEPHGSDTIRLGTLREYLRKLKVTRDEFSDLLYGTTATEAEDDDKFRRSLEPSGHIVSNCNKCYGIVGRSIIESEIIAAEATHSCSQPSL